MSEQCAVLMIMRKYRCSIFSLTNYKFKYMRWECASSNSDEEGKLIKFMFHCRGVEKEAKCSDPN